MNSLLSELPLPTHKTWLLPHMDTLCVIRYLEVSHETATPNGQGGKDTKHGHQEEEPFGKLQALDDWPAPGVRALGDATTREGRQDRAIGHGRPARPGRPTTPRATDDRRPPDDRHLGTRVEINGRPTPLNDRTTSTRAETMDV